MVADQWITRKAVALGGQTVLAVLRPVEFSLGQHETSVVAPGDENSAIREEGRCVVLARGKGRAGGTEGLRYWVVQIGGRWGTAASPAADNHNAAVPYERS